MPKATGQDVMCLNILRCDSAAALASQTFIANRPVNVTIGERVDALTMHFTFCVLSNVPVQTAGAEQCLAIMSLHAEIG